MKSAPLCRLLPLVLAGLALSACNETSQPAATQVVPPPCQCTVAQAPQTAVPAAAPVAAVAHLRRFRTHRWAASHSYRYSSWHETETWSESASSETEYASGSYAAQSGRYEGEADSARYAVWVDGYGRRHFVQGGAAEVHDAGWRRHDGDDASRLDPWHGYDAHCGRENRD